MGHVGSVPANFSYLTLLSYSANGVNDAMNVWGGMLFYTVWTSHKTHVHTHTDTHTHRQTHTRTHTDRQSEGEREMAGASH